MGKGASLGSEGPGFDPRDCRGWITSLKTKPDSPEVREDGQGLNMNPAFLHMHIMTIYEETLCHYVANDKDRNMGGVHEALHHWKGRAE